MAIAATVIRDGSAMPTTRALIDVTAECGGATACNGKQDFDVRPTEPPTVALDESSACGADQVGHLPEAADSSISPVVICLSVPTNPEDWPSRAGDAAKDGDSEQSLSGRDDPTGSEWCAGRRRLRASVWQSSGGAREDRPSSESLRGEQRTGTRDAAFWCPSADRRCASDCRGTARRWIFSANAASGRGVLRAERD